jgi:hypothetical protein
MGRHTDGKAVDGAFGGGRKMGGAEEAAAAAAGSEELGFGRLSLRRGSGRVGGA